MDATKELISLLEEQKALLIAVATGGPSIKTVQPDYAERRQRIRSLLDSFGREDPVPFSDLWQWYGRWSDGTLPTYKWRRQFITELFQPLLDYLSSGYAARSTPQLMTPPMPQHDESKLAIFISHSGRDSDLAGALARLLQRSMNLRNEDIRATSVDGYRLKVGTDTNEQLRIEVREARVFVALLTPNSITSTYVLFEMGARWGAGQYFAPVIANDLSKGDMKAPLSGLNVLELKFRSQMMQLLENISEELSMHLGKSSTFERELEELTRLAS